MAKTKTLDQLRAEKEQAEAQLLQEQHKLQRLEQRKKHYEKGERKKRTHRLCNLGGMVESVAPEVKDLTRTEMTELMEHIFSLSEVQRAVRHMAMVRYSIPIPAKPTCLHGWKPSASNRTHSCGMKYPPGREDFLNPLTQTGILFLMPLLSSNYAPYFSNALRITSSQLNSIFIVWSSYR